MSSDLTGAEFRWEQAFARNMATSREAHGYSQNEFARRLRERGLPFHQATVQRIESQERSVRLDEAFLISAELGLSLDQMVQEPSELAQDVLKLTHAVRRSADKTYTEGSELHAETKRFERKARALSRYLRANPDEDVSDDSLERLDRITQILSKLEKQLQMVLNSTRQLAGQTLDPNDRRRWTIEDESDGEH